MAMILVLKRLLSGLHVVRANRDKNLVSLFQFTQHRADAAVCFNSRLNVLVGAAFPVVSVFDVRPAAASPTSSIAGLQK